MNQNNSLSIDTHNIIYEEIDGEVIFINLKTGSYYSLVGTGIEVWRLLEQHCSPKQISTTIATHYRLPQQQVATDVEHFLQTLLQDQVVVLSGTDTPAHVEPVLMSAAYVPPQMTVYEDMQDLLMIDPIHDVDESGWPNAKPT